MNNRINGKDWRPVEGDAGYTAKPVPEAYYQVTEFCHPDEVIETARYGELPYKRYLELEMRRWMEANLRDSWLRENKEGLVALFSWRKYYRNVE